MEINQLGVQWLDNVLVIAIVTDSCVWENRDDNVADLMQRFSLKVYNDPKDGTYNWVCRKCGKLAFTEEVFIPCQQGFMTKRVVCRHGCGQRWSLVIKPRIPDVIRSLQ